MTNETNPKTHITGYVVYPCNIYEERILLTFEEAVAVYEKVHKNFRRGLMEQPYVIQHTALTSRRVVGDFYMVHDFNVLSEPSQKTALNKLNNESAHCTVHNNTLYVFLDIDTMEDLFIYLYMLKKRIQDKKNADEKIATYNNMCTDFLGMYMKYIQSQKEADVEEMSVALSIIAMTKDQAAKFIKYITIYWNAFTMDVIEGHFNYASYAPMVFDAWKEYKEQFLQIL